MTQIWSTLELPPWGSFPEYPRPPLAENTTPTANTSNGDFNSLQFDRLVLPSETLYSVPTRSTIQGAIDALAGRTGLNTRIKVSPGTYYETLRIVQVGSFIGKNGSSPCLQVIGDTRMCAGMSFTHGGLNTNVDNEASLGQDNCRYQITIDGRTVTIVIEGESAQLDFPALGVVAGDAIILRDSYSNPREHVVASVTGNTIVLAGDIGEFWLDTGSTLTICPNVIVTPVVAHSPGLLVQNGAVRLQGIRFRTTPLRTPFLPHILRVFRGAVIASNCMFDDLLCCTYDDCISVESSLFCTREVNNGVTPRSHVTIMGGFNNCILADHGRLDLAIVSAFNQSNCHAVSLTHGSIANIDSLSAFSGGAGTQVYASDGSSASLSRAMLYGWFLAVIAQRSSNVHLGARIRTNQYGDTTISNHYIALHARGGSNINIDGGYRGNTYTNAYLTSGSNIAYLTSSTREIINDWWQDVFVMKGCSYTFEDRADPIANTAVYTNSTEYWWQMLKTAYDTHVIDSTDPLVLFAFTWRNDYIGNFSMVGRTTTVICKQTPTGDPHRVVTWSRLYGAGIGPDDDYSGFAFTAAGQSVTFYTMSPDATYVIANNGATLDRWWW